MKKEKSNNTDVKKKKHIFIKIALVIIIIILIIIAINFIKNKIEDYNNKKFNDKLTSLTKEKQEYAFVEINPSFVLTIKNDKVTNTACLNEDCMSIYDEIKIKGKSISSSIESLYNLAKEKGFDTTNGVKVKSTTKLNIKNKDYIKSEIIDEKTKNELLSKVQNNEDIKEENNDDYYKKLWEELKKDSDYGKLYTCEMENDELKCYLTWEEIDSEVNLFAKQNKWSNTKKVLDKFGIKNKEKQENGFSFDAQFIYIDDMTFELGWACDNHTETIIYENGDSTTTGTNLSYYNDFTYAKGGKLYCITLVKDTNGLNLLNPSSVLDNALIMDDPMAGYTPSEPVYDEEGNIIINTIN